MVPPDDNAALPFPAPLPGVMKLSTQRRFDRTARLIGDAGLAKLAASTVTIFGVGGVGSFAAEGLARAGVGRIILVDFDRVCVTNVNRQIHAMKGTLGKSKVAVMAERLLQINPDMRVEARNEFYNERNSARLLAPEPDVIIDAIDNVTAKIHLLATAVRDRLRIVTAMGAAARMDPTCVKTADLMLTSGCGLAREVRSLLRKNYGIGELNKPLGVTAIYSNEPAITPVPLAYDNGGFECVCPSGDNGLHDCDSRIVINGSSPFVPSVFGMTAASVAVRMITGTYKA